MDLRLDHLYRETHQWAASVDFWTSLGFSFAQQWGEEPHRAGILVRDGASIVLAEVGHDSTTKATVFFASGDVDAFAAQAGAEVVDTHWGTRLTTVTDPDGRVYNIEPGEAT